MPIETVFDRADAEIDICERPNARGWRNDRFQIALKDDGSLVLLVKDDLGWNVQIMDEVPAHLLNRLSK